MLQDGQVIRARVVIGADGSRSCVAPAINLSTPNYAGYSAYRQALQQFSAGWSMAQA